MTSKLFIFYNFNISTLIFLSFYLTLMIAFPFHLTLLISTTFHLQLLTSFPQIYPLTTWPRFESDDEELVFSLQSPATATAGEATLLDSEEEVCQVELLPAHLFLLILLFSL